jgi:hypothetical protein
VSETELKAMKRKKPNLDASTPEISLALPPLSRNDEQMIFPSYNGLSRRMHFPLGDRIGSFTWVASHGVTASSPRSSTDSGVI